MRRLGLRVPPAFTIPVTECRRYHESGGRLDEETWQAVLDGLRWLERETGRRLGDLHDRAAKVLHRFTAVEPRLETYVSRLDAAYDKALAGETDYVSGVRVDSYHVAWHELHEDLLRMLGRTREE